MRRKSGKKEELAEDYCFMCKDGGLLRVCDFKNCLKAYHPECVGQEPSFLDADERWTCGWHACFICQKSSTFQCYCCPNSVCRTCMKEAEFVQLKTTKGFCNNCLKLATLIEENIDVDSDGGKVDFKDTETYEFLFKDYWEIIKDKEGITMVDLHAANALLKKGENFNCGSDSVRSPEDGTVSEVDELEDNFDDGISFLSDLRGKCRKIRTPMKKCKPKQKKRMFMGWASGELIEFLASIGKDTNEMSEIDVCDIIREYIRENNLYENNNNRKKFVICDQRLHSLFRKKKVRDHRIYRLLESHFAKNDVSDDVFSFSSEEDENAPGFRKKRRINSDHQVHKSSNDIRERSSASKNIYASIVGKNISAVYLKRSLVMNLLKNPDSFEKKVTGCFVRFKSDPKEFIIVPQNIYRLGQVTGVKKVAEAYRIREMSIDVVLKVHISNMLKDIQISMLSDEDFEEEECEDLQQSVKKGLCRRPTVAELEDKIRYVHDDIMNHWIDREILKLQKKIDLANEKGWRNELYAHIERREQLLKPDERLRLLKEIPEVIADSCEFEDTRALLQFNLEDKAGNKAASQENVVEQSHKENGAKSDEIVAKESVEENEAKSHENVAEEREENGDNTQGEASEEQNEEIGATSHGEISEEQVEVMRATSNGEASEEQFEESSPVKEDKVNPISTTHIIEIEDNEDDPSPQTTAELKTVNPFDYCYSLWYYIDPSGLARGPFSMEKLIFWRNEGFFDDDFKVWRSGQSQKDAIKLIDAWNLCQL